MRARARLSILCLVTLAAGCGSSLKVGTKDAGPGADATDKRDVEPATFCTGDAPRMAVNGVGLVPTVATYPIAMDCCDGGGVVLTNDALAFPIGVGWLVELSPSYTLPATIDLSSMPEGWHVLVSAGCSVTSADCVGEQDYYRTGLLGWLTIDGYDMSVCVHVEEDPNAPAHLLRSLDLYLPRAD
jgi:hypothetical protein